MDSSTMSKQMKLVIKINIIFHYVIYVKGTSNLKLFGSDAIMTLDWHFHTKNMGHELMINYTRYIVVDWSIIIHYRKGMKREGVLIATDNIAQAQ